MVPWHKMKADLHIPRPTHWKGTKRHMWWVWRVPACAIQWASAILRSVCQPRTDDVPSWFSTVNRTKWNNPWSIASTLQFSFTHLRNMSAIPLSLKHIIIRYFFRRGGGKLLQTARISISALTFLSFSRTSFFFSFKLSFEFKLFGKHA